jgi:hypothetical protein
MNEPLHHKRISLLDLLDRILDTGVVARGDLTLSVAGIDLVYLGLGALLSSVERVERMRNEEGLPPLPRTAAPPLAALPPPDQPLPPITQAPAYSTLAGLQQLADEVHEVSAGLPQRIEANPDNVERGLAKLVLTLIELLRQLMERQAIKRVEGGTLSEAEIERLGITFMRLEQRMHELKQVFGLEHEELNLDLGPLGDLL